MSEAEPAKVLSASVLVLNRVYQPIHVITARRAFVLLYSATAEVIDLDSAGRFYNFDFDAWCELSEFRRLEDLDPHDDWLRAVRLEIRVPRIIRLLHYDRVPKKYLRFSRRSVLARDSHTCQYCGDSLPSHQLSLDHVLPRSRGGTTGWENIVCSCVPCNTRKGDRTPQEARMALKSAPMEPRTSPVLTQKLSNPKYACWRPFLGSGEAHVV